MRSFKTRSFIQVPLDLKFGTTINFVTTPPSSQQCLRGNLNDCGTHRSIQTIVVHIFSIAMDSYGIFSGHAERKNTSPTGM